jgi:hypothetical protein
MSSPVGVTGSQFQMFTNLANPRHTNFNQPEPTASPFIHSGNQQRGAPMRWDAQPTGAKSPSPTAPAAPTAPQFFSKHMDTRTHRSQKSRSSRRSTSTRDSRSRRSRRASRPSSQREDDPPSVHSQVSLNSQQRREIRAEKDAEKMGYLMELKRMSQENRAQLTKEWSMTDAHEDIELEYNRQKMANDTQDSVNFMSSGLKMAMSGIELLNHKYGPWLELDGMANDVCSDMHKYRPALTRIYKRVWRRGSINPWIELLFTLGGAVLMFHVRNKIMGGSSMPSNAASSSSATVPSSFGSSFGGGNSAPMPSATRSNPARNATPFNLGPFASRTPPPPLNRNISRGPTAPPVTVSAPRGRMRRPTSPGGTPISHPAQAGNNPLASMMGGGGNPLASMMGGGGNPLGGMMMSTMMGGGGGGGANLMQGLMGGAPPPSTHSPFARAPPTVAAPPPTAVPSFRTVFFSQQTRRQRPTSPPVILREDNDSDHVSFQEDSANQANIEEEDDQGSEHVAIDIDVDDA